MNAIPLILGVYAAVLSTVLGIVQLVNALRDTGKIKIVAYFAAVLEENALSAEQLYVFITNVGRRPILVTGYGGEARSRGGETDQWKWNSRTLPKLLHEAEEAIEWSHEVSRVGTIVGLYVWDSTGKRWKLPRKGLRQLRTDWAARFSATPKTS